MTLIVGGRQLRIAQAVREVRATPRHELPLLLDAVSIPILPTLLAICIDHFGLSASSAQAILERRWNGGPVPQLAKIIANYRSPWWAPWRRGSAIHAIEVWRQAMQSQ
jgi:hypothetical protein